MRYLPKTGNGIRHLEDSKEQFLGFKGGIKKRKVCVYHDKNEVVLGKKGEKRENP